MAYFSIDNISCIAYNTSYKATVPWKLYQSATLLLSVNSGTVELNSLMWKLLGV